MTDATPAVVEATTKIEKDIIASYLYLRRGIGIIGLALPFVLVFGHDITARGFEWRASISSYYYTDMRNILVGSMCAVGVFLFCYKYDLIDDILSNIAGVCAIVVALFPTATEHPSRTGRVVGIVHLSAAVALFALFAWFCLFLFTRTDPVVVGPKTANKNSRNRVYRLCGGVIVVAVILGALTDSPLVSQAFQDSVHPLLWCEWAAIVAFGAAWLVKGKTLLKD